MSDSCYPVVLASSLTSFSLFRFAHNVSGDLKIGGIRNGDENPDDMLHLVTICNIPRPIGLTFQPRFSYHDPFIDVLRIRGASFGELEMKLYDEPTDGMLVTVRSDRISFIHTGH